MFEAQVFLYQILGVVKAPENPASRRIPFLNTQHHQKHRDWPRQTREESRPRQKSEDHEQCYGGH